ncbi:ATP/GTP-binding protein [Cyclobacterium xiamenense]|uniref:AAA family ATPase n=1 Tax=Cyclobacterium xiamenense TaxID=1297121 RepID=UPI0035CEA14C
MIVRFSVQNFRSIKERMEISFKKTGLKGMPTNYFEGPSKTSLLKTAVLYGPNASGKSTFLKAFKALEYLVLSSAGFKPDQAIPPYEPHLLDTAFREQPVEFRIEFFGGDHIKYELELAFLEKEIVREEMYYYPNGVQSLLYQRVQDKDIKFGDGFRGAKKTIERLLLPNQLFISKAAENNVESLLPAYRFFGQGMMVFPFLNENHESNLTRLYARRLAEEGESGFSRKLNALICALDTGILAVSAKEVDEKSFKFPDHMPEDLKKKIKDDFKYDIRTAHPLFENNKIKGKELFDVEEESTGTKSLLVIGGIILDSLEAGRVLVVDEFEKNLHPSITNYLIGLFHNPLTNPKNAQLIFATHDITQLASGEFRRDQIWFTEKNEFGATELYACSEIKGVRSENPLDKWYASGKLGATPIINDVDFLIEMQENVPEETE